MTFTADWLTEVSDIALLIDHAAIEACADLLAQTREARGRVFVLGVGGSAANASHAVNDLRKITGIEAYTPADNVAELTARTNDDGWHTVFVAWLQTSQLGPYDLVMVLSVNGGRTEVSANLVAALTHARAVGAKIMGIVGRGNGYTAQVADACVVIPMVSEAHVTPHSESFQSVICHLLVWHPKLA